MRPGADVLDEDVSGSIRRSVRAAQWVLMMAVRVRHSYHPRMVVGAVIKAVPVITRILIGWIWRESAGAGEGRALVHVIILMPHRGGMILQRRIRQPLIAPAAAAGIATGISIGLRARADIAHSAWR